MSIRSRIRAGLKAALQPEVSETPETPKAPEAGVGAMTPVTPPFDATCSSCGGKITAWAETIHVAGIGLNHPTCVQ